MADSVTSTQSQITDLPDWARPYAKSLLEKTQAFTDKPYEAYGGDRIAGFSPMQLAAQQQAQGMSAGPEAFSQGIGAYMSPYMQNVVDIQKREAARQSDIMGQQQQAQAAQAGAFGGSRDAIMRAERERNLGQQMGDIQARGSQAAYDQAANQFRQGITQGMDINRLQSAYGGQQQALRQQGLSQAYQDWQNQQNQPYQQLGFMSNLIRGIPASQTTQVSSAPAPSGLSTLAGLGAAGYGLSRFFAAGGSVNSPQNVESFASKLSDQQLDQAEQAATVRGDQEQLQIVQMEKAERAAMRRGIAALPTPNMPTEYADGGIVAFADRGSVVGKYEQQIRDEAERQGVDPDLMVRMFARESAGDPNAVSRKGAAGLGQLMPDTAREMGLSDSDRFNPDKNIPASVGYFKKQLGKFGDPEKAAAAYNWGPGALERHLQKKPDDWKIGLPEETAAYLTKVVPVGSAQATPAQPRFDEPASQIPTGGTGAAPAATSDVSYFGGLADRLGIPEEYQRNINNTLSALGGFSMPVAWASKASQLASKGLEPTAEAVAKATQLKQVAETPRLMPPAKAGLEALDAAAQTARATAEAARRSRGLEADVKAAKGAQQSVDAAAKSAQIAREMEAALRAKGATAGLNATKAANVGRGITAMQAADQALREGAENRVPFSTGEYRGKSGDPDQDIGPAQQPQPAKADIIAAAKNAVPDGINTKGWTPDDWLTLGFSLLANKSPYFMQSLGTAGLGVLAARQARAKTELEQRKAEQEIALGKAHEKYYGAAAQRYEAEDKPLAQMQKQIAAAYLKLEADPLLKLDPLKMAAEKRRVTAEIRALYPDLTDTMGAGAGTGIAAPQGVKVTQIG